MSEPRTDASSAERIADPPPSAVHYPETSAHEPAVRPWELELLISGAVVFSLLQVPGHVDGWFARVEPHAAGATHFGVFMLYLYLKLILYTLIACFVLHLSMRAYWVGLIGLEAVFPRGVRWEDSSYGPVMMEVFRAKLGRLQTRIDAADRFCSVLFPLAFTVVMLFLFSVLMLVVAAALAFATSRLVWNGDHFDRTLLGVFAVFMGIPVLTFGLDRAVGPRLRPGGRGHRMLRRASVASYYLNAMPIYGATFLTLLTNARKRARYPAGYAMIAVLFGFFLLKDVVIARGALSAGDHLYLADADGAFGVAAGVYENQRDPDEDYARLPSIQSDVVRDPYVKLFIPYAPLRHGEAFAERCPGVRPLSDGGLRLGDGAEPDSAAVRAVLDCWTRLQPVTLNGAPIRPRFHFYAHPESGVRGILAYIPVADLPRGENVLVVAPPPRTRAREQRGGKSLRRNETDPHLIRFWL